MHPSKSIDIGAKIKIDNKIHHYRSNLGQSEKKFVHKSANARLADQIYSRSASAPHKTRKTEKSNNKSQSPLKNRRLKPKSKSEESSKKSIKSSSSSSVMKGLEDRTVCLSELVQKNSSLLIQKKQLEQRIAFYKQQISLQNRLYSQSQIKLKQHQDQIVQQYERMKKKEQSVSEVQEKSVKEINECIKIKKQIDIKVHENEIIKVKIRKVKRENKIIEKQIQGEHRAVRKTAVESVQVKNLLRQSQKRLIHETVQKEQLTNQKANLMIEANQISQKISNIVYS